MKKRMNSTAWASAGPGSADEEDLGRSAELHLAEHGKDPLQQLALADLGEIDHVDIVAYAGAIGRRIIIAEHRQPLAPADRHLRNERHQVVRYAARILADQPAFMRADRVEVAQHANAP